MMVNKIVISKLELYAFHGCDTKERKKGGVFTVDVELVFDFDLSADNDDLKSTLDYAKIIDVIKKEMKIPSKLIEAVTKRILKQILNLGQKSNILIDELSVNVTKLNPPLNIKSSGISSVIIYKNV